MNGECALDDTPLAGRHTQGVVASESLERGSIAALRECADSRRAHATDVTVQQTSQGFTGTDLARHPTQLPHRRDTQSLGR